MRTLRVINPIIWPLFLAWLFCCAVGHVNPVLFVWFVFRRKILPEIGAGVILAQAVFLIVLVAGVWFVWLVFKVF
jgi:hypothetical protein